MARFAKFRSFCIALLFSSLGLLAGCSEDVETVVIGINGHEYTVEVARTTEEHEIGLMNRESLPKNRGMLFVYGADRRLNFWMKNTRIPLSIAFISKEGEIKEIYDMEPGSLRNISSRRSVRYALEVNRGAFQAIGAEPGTFIEFPEDFL